MSQPNIFVNQFSKSSENANIGMGTLVGIDVYSKKGVAQLTKDTTPVPQGTPFAWPSMPKYIASDGNLNYAAVSTTANAQVYSSIDGGITWNLSHDVGSAVACGLINYQGYFILFTSTAVYYFGGGTSDPTDGLTQWSNFSLNAGEHPSILFPTDNAVYFGNQNFMGRFGLFSTATFNPAGTINVDYTFSTDYLGFLLPLGYQVNCLSFLLPNFLALGTGGTGATSQIADLILWDPLSGAIPQSPLRLYSRSSSSGVINGAVQNGIAQIVNRNNTLYCVTGGNFAVYETNGTNFSLITDLSLHSSIRKPTGMETTTQPYLAGYSAAMTVIGNRLFIGISTPNSPSYPTGYGLFPCGVWTIAFSDGGGIGEISYGINGNSVQCEFTISTNTIVATGNNFQIGAIFPLTGGSALISWTDNNSGTVLYGMDYINFGSTSTYYQNDIDTVIIESEMVEVGTPLNPVTIGNLQFNLVRNLMTGQTISLYYRTAFDQDFTLVKSYGFNGVFTGDGTTNQYSVTAHQIAATRYVQFQIHMATVPSSTDAVIATYTPQLRDFIIGNPTKS